MPNVKSGQQITLSTTEQNYDLVGDTDSRATTVVLTLVSGDMIAAVGPKLPPTAIIDSTYGSWSTAGDKAVFTFSPALSNLRMKCTSSGVVKVNW